MTDELVVTVQRNDAPVSVNVPVPTLGPVTLAAGTRQADVARLADMYTEHVIVAYLPRWTADIAAVLAPPKAARTKVEYDDRDRVIETSELPAESPSVDLAASAAAAVALKLIPAIRQALSDGMTAALRRDHGTKE